MYNIWIISNADYRFAAENIIGQCLTKTTMHVLHNIEARSCNRYGSGKAIIVTYSEYVSVALVIQHAKWMRRVILSVTCPAVPYLSTLSRKRYDFRKTVIEYTSKICVLIFLKIMSETFLILTIIQLDIIINVHRSSRKVPVILVRF